MSASQVLVNGSPTEILAGESLDELITRLALHTKGVAVAINAVVVSRSSWPTTLLVDGDVVEILAPNPGG